MIKIICVSVAAGVIAFTAVPVVGVRSLSLAEPYAMLLTATAFFGLAFATRWRWKGRR